MIYIFTALYCEAEELIGHYKLYKNKDISKYQVFENENIRLAVTGSGSIPAAVAVTYICAKFSVCGQDTVLNLGCCAGSSAQIGEIFCCNKVVDAATRRSYYPDMLYRQPFDEKTVVTVPNPVSKPWNEDLADMEAAAVYQAAIHFVPAHRIFILKIVSDNGDTAELKAAQVRELFASCGHRLADFVDRLAENACAVSDEEEDIGSLVRDMRCSDVMEKSLRQLLRYCRLAGIDCTPAIRQMYDDEKLPCGSRREGKKYLEELRRQLL